MASRARFYAARSFVIGERFYIAAYAVSAVERRFKSARFRSAAFGFSGVSFRVFKIGFAVAARFI